MRRMIRYGLACLAALGAGDTWAHGGFAETHSFTPRRGHPEQQWMGFTQGALVSRDSGASWRWVCAEAMGYGGWMPERFVWRADGMLLAATGTALISSRDEGCTWSTASDFGEAWVTGLAAHPTDDAVLYLSTGRPGTTNALHRSEDGGRTWRPTALRREAVFSDVRVAPSAPRRLYVSGAVGYAPYVFRSDDAGETWREWPLALEGAYDAKLLAVSPVRPDVLWVRVSLLGPAGMPRHVVLRSDDGGQTFGSVLDPDDLLVNMEVSEDGRTAWVATYNHVYRGGEGGAFTRLALPAGNACVAHVAGALYACGSTWANDWELARSADEGTTWTPLLSLRELRGVHECPAGTPVRDLCSARWPQLAEQLGVTSPTPGPGDAGPPPDAGAPPPAKSGGCGSTPGSESQTPWGLLGCVSCLALSGRRRRAPT
ncbi:hypothetical protein I3V78_21235 [Archangium primigenium]|nr:hypothetical protein [Archangium primigenium]